MRSSTVETIIGSLGDCVDLAELLSQELVGELGDEAADCVAGEQYRISWLCVIACLLLARMKRLIRIIQTCEKE